MSLLAEFQHQFQPVSHSCFLIAFSGGLDSTALLSLLAKLRENRPHFQLRAIHIHHGLSANADHWAQHCTQLCAHLDIPLIIEKVNVDKSKGTEGGAREARYQAIVRHLQPNEMLLTAHHLQDQTETFLLALKRGSGIQGLGAMQPQSAVYNLPVFRPLLNFTRQQLEDYVRSENLPWVEDESNDDNRYDRNFLRNQVLPLLRNRWAHFDQAVRRSAQHCFEQQQLINELLADEFTQIYQKNDRTLVSRFSLFNRCALRRILFVQYVPNAFLRAFCCRFRLCCRCFIRGVTYGRRIAERLIFIRPNGNIAYRRFAVPTAVLGNSDPFDAIRFWRF